MSKGERIEGRVRDVVQSGDAVIETERGLVFARGALPGERVVVSLDDKRGRTQRGRLVTVLERAAERVEAPCAHVERCGGCGLMHASEPFTRDLKTRFLRDALRKAGAPDTLSVAFHEPAARLGYRRRARLAFRVSGKARELGYHRERSRDLVDIPGCAVLVAPLDAALTALRQQLLPRLAGEGEISLALGERGGAVAVVHASAAQSPELYPACAGLVESGALEGVALFAGGATKPAVFGAPTEWSTGADGQSLEGTLGGFSQAHAEVNQVLVARVLALAEPANARVLELYAGHGNLTVLLARGAQAYTAVEQDPSAVQALRKNLAGRGLSAKIVAGDAAAHLGSGPLDVLVLDPPRAGAPGILAAASARKPRRIVYVSCDPATLARDVGEVLPRGYHLAAAEAFDMFPHTADLESLVLLVRT
jgi:23S rRNA (uracil1939-C5)-methyltransferase